MKPLQLPLRKIQKKKTQQSSSRSQLSFSALFSPDARKKVTFKQDLDISRSMHIMQNFSDQNIESLSSLNIRDYKNLIDLDLSNNKLSNSQPDLLFLQQLKVLNLCNNGIVKMYALSAKLECLNVSNNSIKDLSIVFPQLINLRELNISFNQIESLSGLSGNKTELMLIEAHHNLIQDLEGVETMVNLQNFDVSFNRIRDIKNVQYVRDLAELKFLDLSVNPIIEDQHQVKQLKKIVPNYLQQKDEGVFYQSEILNLQTFTQQYDIEESQKSTFNEFFQEEDSEKIYFEQLREEFSVCQKKLRESEDKILRLEDQKQELEKKLQQSNSNSSNQGGQDLSKHLQNVMQKNVSNMREKDKLQKQLNKVNKDVKHLNLVFDQVQQFLGKTYQIDQAEQMVQDFQSQTTNLNKSSNNQTNLSPPASFRFNMIENQVQSQQSSIEKAFAELGDDYKIEKTGEKTLHYEHVLQQRDFLAKQNLKLQERKIKYKLLYSDIKAEFGNLQQETTSLLNEFLNQIKKVEQQFLQFPLIQFTISQNLIQSGNIKTSKSSQTLKESSSENTQMTQQQKLVCYIKQLKDRSKKCMKVIKILLEQQEKMKQQFNSIITTFSKKLHQETLKQGELMINPSEVQLPIYKQINSQ